MLANGITTARIPKGHLIHPPDRRGDGAEGRWYPCTVLDRMLNDAAIKLGGQH